jgi:hypothetical protein
MGELSDSEKAILAREIAADNYGVPSLENQCEECGVNLDVYGLDDPVRKAVYSGWDAAMDYVAAQFDDNDDPELSAALRKLTPEQLNKILREELGR